MAALRSFPRWCLGASAWGLCLTVACRDAPTPSSISPISDPGVDPAAPEQSSSPLRADGVFEPEGAPSADPLDALSPPDQPVQRLAFSRGRLAWLESDDVWVFELDDFTVASHFRVPDARNVVGLTGGGFLIAGRDHVQRLSGMERRPQAFPRAPRIGPTTILPSRQESEQFWLYYAGITRLPRFDLGAPPLVASLPMLDWTELYAFDRRALLGVGDGSFVYSTSDGLRRIDVEGRREHLPSPELAARLWALARDQRLDRVWAVTDRHLYLLHVRVRVEIIRRFELPPHPVALAADAGTVAVLSVESLEPTAVLLRVDVYVGGASPATVVRFRAPAATTRASLSRFEPELELASAPGLVAVNAHGLQVFDYRRGVRKYPDDEVAQKLAPRAP